MKRSIQQDWSDSDLGPCACSQLRRTTRAMSAFYDDYLKAARLTVTQYALLVNIANARAIQRTKLADQMGMERTTLTRNLKPLERDGLVRGQTGEDRREQMVSLTASGKARLDKGFECWAQAQRAFVEQFGVARLDTLRDLLGIASGISTAATSSTKRTAKHKR